MRQKKLVQAKKYLGQHFLKDEHIAQKIVSAVDINLSDAILEIGPGMGVLTKYLLELEALCYYIEKDKESVAFLQQNYPNIKNYLVEGDFLKLDLAPYTKKQLSIIGNFPYNISSQIFFKLLEFVDSIPQIVGMLQFEVAQRICSPKGNKQYGILSVLLQSFYAVELLFKVPPGVFLPPPKVDSAVVRLVRREDYKNRINCNKKTFRLVVKTAFNQRRKMLSNSLKPMLMGQKIEDKIMNMRPEQLTVEDFVSLTRQIEMLQNK